MGLLYHTEIVLIQRHANNHFMHNRHVAKQSYICGQKTQKCKALHLPVTAAVHDCQTLTSKTQAVQRRRRHLFVSLLLERAAAGFAAVLNLTQEYPPRRQTRLQSSETAGSSEASWSGEKVKVGRWRGWKRELHTPLHRRIRLIICLSETLLLPSLCCQSSIHFLT